MYVCICKAVTERQIHEAIRSGACTRREISACLKAGTECGKCNREIRDLLRGGSEQRGLSRRPAGRLTAYSGPVGHVAEVCV